MSIICLHKQRLLHTIVQNILGYTRDVYSRHVGESEELPYQNGDEQEESHDLYREKKSMA